jgi:hypothetical protein
MYTSSLDTGTSIFLVLVIHLFSIFARSVRVLFDTENRSSKTGMMLAICIDFSSLVDNSLGLLFLLSSLLVFVSVSLFLLFLFVLKSFFQLAF